MNHPKSMFQLSGVHYIPQLQNSTLYVLLWGLCEDPKPEKTGSGSVTFLEEDFAKEP